MMTEGAIDFLWYILAKQWLVPLVYTGNQWRVLMYVIAG